MKLFNFGAVASLLGASVVAEDGLKIDVCHFPPGKMSNFKSQTIGLAALNSSRFNRDGGDMVGLCDNICDKVCHRVLELSACEAYPSTGTCEEDGCIAGLAYEIDLDGDDFSICPGPEQDCDDSNPDIFPGNEEKCDGLDNDCNGVIDDGGDALCDDSQDCSIDTCTGSGGCTHAPIDDDGDSFNICPGPFQDCDDSDPLINPDAKEVCDGVDNNCDGEVDECARSLCDDGKDCTVDICDGAGGCLNIGIDMDNDGYDICVGPNQDCNDFDRAVHPGLPEVCDGKDNDCNGIADDGDLCGSNEICFGGSCICENGFEGNPLIGECCAETISRSAQLELLTTDGSMSITFTDLPRAEERQSTVEFSFTFSGDLDSVHEYYGVALDGTDLGDFARFAADNCVEISGNSTMGVESFNAKLSDGELTFDFDATGEKIFGPNCNACGIHYYDCRCRRCGWSGTCCDRCSRCNSCTYIDQTVSVHECSENYGLVEFEYLAACS